MPAPFGCPRSVSTTALIERTTAFALFGSPGSAFHAVYAAATAALPSTPTMALGKPSVLSVVWVCCMAVSRAAVEPGNCASICLRFHRKSVFVPAGSAGTVPAVPACAGRAAADRLSRGGSISTRSTYGSSLVAPLYGVTWIR